MSVRVSICVDTRRPWPQVRRIAELADRPPWHAVYVSDHFMPYAPDGPADVLLRRSGHSERPGMFQTTRSLKN